MAITNFLGSIHVTRLAGAMVEYPMTVTKPRVVGREVMAIGKGNFWNRPGQVDIQMISSMTTARTLKRTQNGRHGCMSRFALDTAADEIAALLRVF